MSNDPAKLIRSSDPQDRMKGIKLVARMQNERALRVLAGLADHDDDAQVRALAKRGAAYVAKKLDERGELEIEIPHHEEEDEGAAPAEPVEISENDEKRANSYVATAFDQHINGDKAKAVQSLSKALSINPNLRFDDYFTGVATSVTGLEAEEALKSLSSDRKRKRLLDAETQRKTEQALSDHMEKAEEHTWSTLMVDISVISAIAFLGMFLTVLMIGYTGNIFLDNEVQTAVDEAIEEAGLASTLTEEELLAEQEALRAEAESQEQIIAVRAALAELGLGFGLLLGFGTWLSMLSSILVYSATAHGVASAMDAQGKMTYTIYNILGAYQFPLLIMFGLLMLGPILLFLGGLPPRWTGIGLAIGLTLVLLVISFRVSGRLRRSYYNLGFGKATLAGLIAGIPSGIVTLIVAALIFFLAQSTVNNIAELLPADQLVSPGG